MNDDYNQILDWLHTRASEAAFFRKKELPSLSEVNRALDLLKRPDKSFKFRVIVGGTAGKGSVCRHIEQTLLQEGMSVGLLSSPHLQVVNERIRLNGKIISKADFTYILTKLKILIEAENLTLTYYEILVVGGILLATEKGIEILICEVGLGGEFDAVNAVQGKRICGLTFIGSDHLEILGPKLENIAETKSKIFTQDSIANFTYEQKFRSILEKNSHHKIEYIKGIKQKLNKKLARKILEQIFSSKSFEMPPIPVPCRWEKIDKKTWLDGAHSRPRFEYLIETKLKKNPGPYTLVLGMQNRHESEAFSLLFPFAKNIIWTESGEADCRKSEDLKSEFRVGEFIKNHQAAFQEALKLEDKILVTGSLYLCGAIRENVYSSQAILDQQTEWPL
ncbi:hypothetical protein GW756_02020 [bacterium]|nr:hypothetical protein [bacterium]NCQ55569.1 hypothetical protein [Candidatus Parcubacteria bacterium]NCS67394.1 hypothetical protein [Candidatus Peregrinibacteria bacterium]NCS96120.1 hypothetical protein [bacterium]